VNFAQLARICGGFTSVKQLELSTAPLNLRFSVKSRARIRAYTQNATASHMATAPKSIDEYLKGVTPERRAALQKLRQQILRVVPSATECISYSMPAFRLEGGVVAGFLATSKGCSYFPFSGTTLDGMAAQLTKYGRTKSGLHFDPKVGLPSALVSKLIEARQAEMKVAPHKGKTKTKTKTKAKAKAKAKAKLKP
jgi:uncharacterized protein YdhG (YjbR/CyaY superfamily)